MTDKSANGKFENQKKMKQKLAGQNGADISTGAGTKARQNRAEQEKNDNQTPGLRLVKSQERGRSRGATGI